MHYRLPFKLSVLLVVTLFTACQPFYAPLTHSTPCFTDQKQIEVSAGVGFISTSASVAFSPVKYLSVQASGYRYSDLNGSEHFSDYGEAGIGAYFPYETGVIAFNTGYGFGFANWQAKSLSYSENNLTYASYVSKKYFGQLYLGFKIGEEAKSYTGLSLKLNKFHNTFYEYGSNSGNLPKSALPTTAQSFELVYFLKQNISKRVYFDMSTGLAIARTYTSGIFRFGLSVRIGKVPG